MKGNGTLSEKELLAKIAAAAEGTAVEKSRLYQLEYQDQKDSTDYLESSIHWLFNIPTFLCVFVLLISIRRIVHTRKSMRDIFESMGFSWRKLALIISGEILLFTLISTGIGVALGRAFSVLLISYLNTLPVSKFTADMIPTHVSQFLLTFAATILLALLAIGYMIINLQAVTRKAKSDSSTLKSAVEIPEVLQSDGVRRNTHRNFLSKVFISRDAKTQNEMLPLELLLVAFIISINIYYVVIIPENLLRIAAIGAELENLRHLTTVTIVVLVGILLFIVLRKLIPLLLQLFTKNLAAAANHASDPVPQHVGCKLFSTICGWYQRRSFSAFYDDAYRRFQLWDCK
ncbi:FtsX-like permease family protein [Arcanobacterium hippocoleae]